MLNEWPFGDLAVRRYAALLVDPPWHFKSRTELQMSNWDSRRDVDKHYRTMALPELAALPVGALAARDAHLFMWTTGPCLQAAFGVMEAWGFRYSSIAFAWVKLRKAYHQDQYRVTLPASDLHVGLGLTTRKNVELCLLGRKGSPRRISKAVREVILAPRREHSRKPDEVYERVEAYCAGPYVELFARQRRPGWESWGDEAEKFSSQDAPQGAHQAAK